MWLDRFSGNSTPVTASPPQSRSYSPAPKRTSHLAPTQRTGLGLNGTRSTTSLDLSANTSNSSLPLPRVLNASSLRQEQHLASDVPDPLKILRSILGVEDETANGLRGQPDGNLQGYHASMVDEISFGDLSLQEYVDEVEDVPKNIARETTRPEKTTLDRQKYEKLHISISQCDDVLKSVESYMTSFQAELGEVSAEIESLQARSVHLNAKLENRRKVEKLLGPSVEEISISPLTVRIISEGPVDEYFVAALNEVENRSKTLETKSSDSEPFKALDDVRPLLADLKSKAVERIRDYIVAQIKALRSPSINAQLIQQQTFVKYKDLYSFLTRNHAVLAEEISQAYVNTMKWYYSSNFARYQQALEKLTIYTIDQHDLLGAEPSIARRNVPSGTKSTSSQQDTFGIGRRSDPLRLSEHTPAISSYLAEDSKSTHYLETAFLNFNRALIDNVCAEYSVLNVLFSTQSFQVISRKAVEIFEPTFTLGQNFTRSLIDNTTDCLGVLLCVRLNQHFAFEMQRKKVPVADSYINFTNILLWPRFQKIMDMHCESLKRIHTSTGRGTVAAFSLVGGSDASKASVAPHAVTQRFGQLLQGILTLSAEAGDDEPIANSLGRLRSEFEALMAKLAKSAGDVSKRTRFLNNNYNLVETIISDTHGKLAEEQKAHFAALIKDLKAR